MKVEKVAVLTSGGDAPGMNACIRAVVRSGLHHGLEVFGVMRGYEGLQSGRWQGMTRLSVSNIIQRGGTILKTARSMSFLEPEGRAMAANLMREAEISSIIVIGGDGSYKGASVFAQEHPDIKVLGLPGTIDNDLFGTDYTIGYDTAINTALESIDRIRDTADSHDRMFFVEVMGRHAGFIAVDVGIGGGAEAILIPEVDEGFNQLLETIQIGWGRKKTSQLIIVAEGDEMGGATAVVERVKVEFPQIDCRVVVLGHIQRGGSPTARDRVLASKLGNAAIDKILEGGSGLAGGEVNGEIVWTPLLEAATTRKLVDKRLLDLANILSA